MQHLLQILREYKLEIKERLKMQRYYGVLQNPVDVLKTLRPGVRSNKSTRLSPQVKGEYQDDAIPVNLNAKLKRIKDLNKINKRIFDNPPSVTFISYSIPRIDTTSSNLRLCHIIKILLENRCKINLLYSTELWNDSRYIKTFKGDIDFIHLPLDLKAYVKFLSDNKSKYVWVTELWRITYVKFVTKLVEEIETSCPSSKLIVDTVDFHYKEFHRKYELTGNQDDLKLANEFLDKEKVLYRKADTIVVISEEEKKDIQDKIPGTEKIEIVPNVHEILYDVRPYSKRKNICFVGHFGNMHNVDAVAYFIEKIFPFILEKNPGVEFHILGYSADRYRSHFKSSNVRVIGGLKYLEEALTYYKLFVCPMTYGAGMKGKIGGAIAAGIPVVTTAIGAEGFPLRDGEECFIADSPTEFAEKCNQCLRDPDLWHNFSVKARLMVAENFSPSAVSNKIEKVLL